MRFFPFRRARRDAELDEEIRAHLRMAEADRVARGESDTEAAYAARREFGNIGIVKEVTREMWGGLWRERLVQDLRYAARSLRRAPGFAAVAVLTLALGIGANSAMFTVVNGVLLRPLPFARADRLFLVSYGPAASPFMTQPVLADRDYLAFREATQAFASVATFTGSPVTLTGAGEPVRLAAAEATPEFMRVLGVAPAIGSGFAADDGKRGRAPVALLSDELWRSRFGADPRIVGKPVTIDGVAHTVVGVMPAGFSFPEDAQLWRPIEVRIEPNMYRSRPVVGRLRDGMTRAQAQAELEALAAQFSVFPGYERGDLQAAVLPLAHLVVGDVRRPLWVFAGAVAFVLLIACANVANLSLMRAASRRQEIAVRAALGASRARLVRQLLTESVVIATVGGALGVLLAFAGVRGLVALAPAGKIPRVEEIHVGSAVILFTATLSLLTGLLFGLAPALRATRRELREALGQGARTTVAGQRGLRGALVVSEIALALVLLAGAGLMVRSFLHMRAVDLGFRPANVVSMTVDLPEIAYRTVPEMRRFHQSVLERLAHLPGVDAASAVNWRPLGGMLIAGNVYPAEGRPQPPNHMVDKPVVSAGYFRAMGIRVLRGREFTERDDASAPGVAIVSQSVARRFWPGEDAVGQRLTMEDKPRPEDWLTVVGVVDDVVQMGVTSGRGAAVYQPYLQARNSFFLGHMTFVVRAANPTVVAPEMRAVLRDVDRNLPAQSLGTMAEVVAASTAEPLFQARLLTLFSILALALAAVGIYGVLAYSVTERTHEIGVRVALGARARDIVRMVLGQTLALSIPGLLLGAAGALAVTRLIAKLLFGVKPNDPATLAAVAGLLVLVALVAALVPARRAARVDPLVALKAE